MGRRGGGDVLVLPAASSPSMSRRISRDPKILPMILETWPPMTAVVGSHRFSQATKVEYEAVAAAKSQAIVLLLLLSF